MSRHTKNPDCSVAVVKLAGYNSDDHFLLPMLKGALLMEFNTWIKSAIWDSVWACRCLCLHCLSDCRRACLCYL